MMLEKEYIEREAAIKEFSNNGSIFVYGMQQCKAIISRINAIPAADVRPVVLCQYCEHFQQFRPHDGFCKIDGMLWNNDFFCANGIMREENRWN